MWNKIAMEIATCGMHRCSKPGIGTVGAFIGLLIQIAMAWIPSVWPMVAVIVIAFVIGIVVTEPAEVLILELYGPRQRHTGEIVNYDFNQDCFDEVIGQIIAGLPVFVLWNGEELTGRVWAFFVAFVAFRVFDILKPGPISKVERLFEPGSCWGIILDDVVAGMFAWPALGIVKYFGM